MADEEAKGAEFTFKVVVNKQKTKVLFAEVDHNFADVLLSFLTLPLGKTVTLLKKHYADDKHGPVNIGSLTSLCDGISNLSNVCFCTEGCKEMLLDPRSSFEPECRKLKLDIHEAVPTKYFLCENVRCCYSQTSMYGHSACGCGKTLKREVDVVKDSQTDNSNGVFTINTASFLIADDLRMVPNVAVSIMETLRNIGITNTDDAELTSATFGLNEIMDLLKGSLLSCTPLTDIILNKGKIRSPTVGYEPETLLRSKIEKETESNSKKKMNLKLMVQESTNKLLFAQADDDFVDFLFTLLTVPLGGVLDCVLGSHTNGLKSIDNLYRSVKTLIDDKYFLAPDTKTRLMKPKLPRGFMSKNPILPLSEEESVHWLYYNCNADKKECLSYSDTERKIRIAYPKRESTDYVKGPTMYMVSDDLTVKPLSMSYSISFLNEMKIPLSDIKEVEVQIGLQEAISILKASLTSTSALTDGLMINPVSNKKRKLEH
ncbi:hypothetical protein ABFS83_13G016700 [Erythranthe nasuta]